MANTAALLAELLSVKASLNTNKLQQIFWTTKYNANAAQVAKYAQLTTAWEEKYGDCMKGKGADGTDPHTLNGKEYYANEIDATEYANECIGYCYEDLEEQTEYLSSLDTQYEIKTTGLAAAITQLEETQKTLTQQVATCAQDNCMIGGK